LSPKNEKERPNDWLQRRGTNPRKLRRWKYHEKEPIAASAASYCSAAGTSYGTSTSDLDEGS